MTFTERKQQAYERAEYRLEFEMDDPEEGDATAIAVTARIDETSGMIVEVGAGPSGVYATATAYRDDEPAEVDVVAVDSSVMVLLTREDNKCDTDSS